MNKRRLGEIARWLEAGAPEKKGVKEFNMGRWIDGRAMEAFDKNVHKKLPKKNLCGTTCCIGGTASAWYSPELVSGSALHNDGRAATLLGLTKSQAADLFYAREDNIYLYSIKAPWAARCIRNLIKTGKVDWEGTRKAPRKKAVKKAKR